MTARNHLTRLPYGAPHLEHFPTGNVGDSTENPQPNSTHQEARVNLIHAHKLEITGRMASAVAHDFANILAVIGGYAAQRERILAIEARGAQQAEVDRILSNIEATVARGTAVTQRLLAFISREPRRLQVFDAADAIAGLESMLRQMLPREIVVELPVYESEVSVQCDRNELELMILNIAANARDAMPNGGSFGIDLQTTRDGFASIILTDTGQGMTEEVQNEIFEPFFTTKAANGGTGLGLAIVQQMVQDAGGHVSVQSALGQGSAFHIKIPLTRATDDSGDLAI